MLEDVTGAWEKVKLSKEKMKIHGKISVQFSFDRKKPTMKLWDNMRSIELNEAEVSALREYLNNINKPS
jgi:hypothetical protein